MPAQSTYQNDCKKGSNGNTERLQEQLTGHHLVEASHSSASSPKRFEKYELKGTLVLCSACWGTGSIWNAGKQLTNLEMLLEVGKCFRCSGLSHD